MGARRARLAMVVALAVTAGAAWAQESRSPAENRRPDPWPTPPWPSLQMPTAPVPPTTPPKPPPKPPIELRTIDDVFLAMEVCWQANLPALPVPGMTVRIRVSFLRSGEMFGEPRFTFKTQGVPPDTASTYQRAAVAALSRCNPLPFSDGLGNAVAGRPFVFDFTDRRTQKGI